MERVRRVCGDGQQTYLLDALALGKSSVADLPEWIKEALDTSLKDTEARDRILQRQLEAITHGMRRGTRHHARNSGCG